MYNVILNSRTYIKKNGMFFLILTGIGVKLRRIGIAEAPNGRL